MALSEPELPREQPQQTAQSPLDTSISCKIAQQIHVLQQKEDNIERLKKIIIKQAVQLEHVQKTHSHSQASQNDWKSARMQRDHSLNKLRKSTQSFLDDLEVRRQSNLTSLDGKDKEKKPKSLMVEKV